MNPYKIEQQQRKADALVARCQDLLRSGRRVEAVRLYRAETRVSLKAAMVALGLT